MENIFEYLRYTANLIADSRKWHEGCVDSKVVA